MRTMMDAEDEEENEEFSANEEEMIDKDVTDDLGNDEVHDALSTGTVISSGTHVPVPQVCTSSAESQLPSALRAVQTAPRPGQLGTGVRRHKSYALLFPAFTALTYGQVTSLVQDLSRLGQTLVTTAAVNREIHPTDCVVENSIKLKNNQFIHLFTLKNILLHLVLLLNWHLFTYAIRCVVVNFLLSRFEF